MCLLRSVLLAEMPEVLRYTEETQMSPAAPAPPGDGPSYNLAPGCLPLITGQVER